MASDPSEAEELPASSAAETETEIEMETETEVEKWPGWPGHCVFRAIVPVVKVGSIIGRKGELIKKMCEETGARIRVLDGPIGNPDRVVLVSGKEDPLLPLSPAMSAVIRVFRRVSDESSAAASFRFLVASTQAINLIGKQGSVIKAIQESTGSSVRVLSSEEAPMYASADERVVELQGESSKVAMAIEAVISHLRKFLVDQTVLPLFEKSYSAAAPAPATAPVQDRQQVDPFPLPTAFNPQNGLGFPLGLGLGLGPKRESGPQSMYFDREAQMDLQMGSSGISLYGLDPTLNGIRASSTGAGAGLSRVGGPIVTQVVQTMQIPLSYAEDIIGIEGSNIAYIRRSSGAILTVQESRGHPEEIIVEIKGTSTQVHMAEQLIQDVITNKEVGYGRSSYPQMSAPLPQPPTYPPSSSMPYPISGAAYPNPAGLSSAGYATFRL